MKNVVVILLIFTLLSCKEEVNKEKVLSKEEVLIQKLSPNDVELGEPKFGDWLFDHEEKGQTFNQYINSSPIRPSKKRNVIYLQPIGVC